MGRDELLKQKRDREEALKEVDLKHKNPTSIKYDIFNDKGENIGNAEYLPQPDELIINAGRTTRIDGNILRSLRDVIDKLLDWYCFPSIHTG